MTLINDLLVATNNQKKLQEIRQILSDGFTGRILCAADFPHLPEPEETAETFEGNAELKAAYYANETGLPALADDSGLVVDALGGRPGVYSARYAATDAERITRLLKELEGVDPAARTARFMCAMCLVVPASDIIHERGTLEGRIGFQPRGSHGFGYDPIFLVQQGDRTLAELSADEKNMISHRGVAMKKIRPALLNALVTKA